MAGRISIVSAERVRDVAGQAHLRPQRRGLTLLVETGVGRTTCCPSCQTLALEIDEHHRHKDVYEHTLTVLEQAIDLESRARPTSCSGSPR
jgi:poly(A) polymerase